MQLLPPLCSWLPEYKQLLPKAGYRIASADEAGEKVGGEKKYEKSAGCDRISHVSGGIAQRQQRFLAGRMIAAWFIQHQGKPGLQIATDTLFLFTTTGFFHPHLRNLLWGAGAVALLSTVLQLL